MENGYVKIQVEQMMPDEYAPTTITINSPKWDMDCATLMEIFHGIAMSMTYSDVSFKNALLDYLANHYDIEIPDEEDK